MVVLAAWGNRSGPRKRGLVAGEARREEQKMPDYGLYIDGEWVEAA
jgi:hypothetical protein